MTRIERVQRVAQQWYKRGTKMVQEWYKSGTTSGTRVVQKWYKSGATRGTRVVNLQRVVQERNQGAAILIAATPA